MSRTILYVDDDLDNLNKFRSLVTDNVVNESLAIRLDLACGLIMGLAILKDGSYDFVFVDESLASHRITGDLWGAEYLEQRARILNPNIVTVEFVSGPSYNRRVSPDYSLMKPMIYRANEICDILEGMGDRENA